MAKTMEANAKFYVARRDTRWDVYPQRQPEEVVAHDWHGFWSRSKVTGEWFKTPTSYVLEREITREEAEAAPLVLTDEEIRFLTEPWVFDFAFRGGDLYVEGREGQGMTRRGFVGDDQRVREVIAMLREFGREV